MKPLPPWFVTALDQLLTDAYLRGYAQAEKDHKIVGGRIYQDYRSLKGNKDEGLNRGESDSPRVV